MGVRKCDFPWRWLLISNDGDVMPCSHGSAPVGNLRENSIAEIWNGKAMQEVRASVLRDEVHPVCRSRDCPFQKTDVAFPEAKERMDLKETFAHAFDNEWYEAAYPDVAEAIRTRRISSGLEHFVRHGRAEGRKHRLKKQRRLKNPFRAFWDTFLQWRGDAPSRAKPPLPGPIQSLVEYSLELTRVTVPPVEIVIVVSTVCNLSCVMCPHGMGMVERPRHMPLDVVERAAQYIATASRMLVSGLAEPLIAPAFWRVLELTAHRDDLFIRVNSNGHLLTAERAGKLLNSCLSEISFSLDAATPETYARIRGADFDQPFVGISELLRLRAARPDSKMAIYLNMTLMRENLPEAAPFVALAKKMGADAVVLSQLFAFGDSPDWVVDKKSWRFSYSEQMLSRIPNEARHHLREARKRSEELGIPIVYHSHVEEYFREENGAAPAVPADSLG
jgi:radical SAM protein with 4Fe4S-binding SPASM domain